MEDAGGVGEGEFQSLIGRLKTAPDACAVGLEGDWFQSLIGRLKTPERIGRERRLRVFQSLIGRLKTRLGARGRGCRRGVSIPHR